MNSDIIDYLTLKYLVDQEFDCPVGRRMKIAFIMARKAYESMSEEEIEKIKKKISKRQGD